MTHELAPRLEAVASKFSELFTRHTGMVIKGPCLDDAREILEAADAAAWLCPSKAIYGEQYLAIGHYHGMSGAIPEVHALVTYMEVDQKIGFHSDIDQTPFYPRKIMVPPAPAPEGEVK